MKKTLFLLTACLFFCNFKFISPTLNRDSRHGEENDISAYCECGTEASPDNTPCDINPPVFNFPNQIFTNFSRTGMAEQVIAHYSSNIFSARNILGTPDGNGAKILPKGIIVVNLSSNIAPGRILTVYWRKETGQPENSTLMVRAFNTTPQSESNDVIAFSTDSEQYHPDTFSINNDTGFLEFSCPGNASLRIDAVTYVIPNGQITSIAQADTIENLMDVEIPFVSDDCDEFLDIDYTDSVGDEIVVFPQVVKRNYFATDDCGNISYASQDLVLVEQGLCVPPHTKEANSFLIPSSMPSDFTYAVETMKSFNKGVIGPNKSLGYPDLAMAQLKTNGKLTVKLSGNLPGGSPYWVRLRQETNDPEAKLQVLESTDLAYWEQSSDYSATTDYGGEMVISFITQKTTRYLKICNTGGTDIFIDAVGSSNIRKIKSE